MKIECVKEKIIDAIYKAEKITGKNLTLPILSHIYLEAKNSVCIIKATNLDLGLEIEIPVKVIEPGKATVPGTVFLNFISNLSGESKMVLEIINNDLFIHGQKTSTKIKTQPTDDFPIIPQIKDEKSFELDAKDFVRGIKSVWYGAAQTSMKPELSSVYVYYDGVDSLVFVATDSFRLAEKKVKIKKGRDISQILIPLKNVSEIMRILESAEGEVDVKMSSNQLAFSWGGVYLVSRIIDGTFPDYKQIIPKEFKTEVTVLKKDLVNSLKLINVFTDTFNQVVMKISPSEKTFELTTQNSTVGETRNSLDTALTGDDLTISFNYKYLVDCFQSIDTDSLVLSFSGLGKPVLVRGVSDRSFLYIVMPMNR
jgi:DNA polymerase-3 subunit beta